VTTPATTVGLTIRPGTSHLNSPLLPIGELGSILALLQPVSVDFQYTWNPQEEALVSVVAKLNNAALESGTLESLFRKSIVRLEGELDFQADWKTRPDLSSPEATVFFTPNLDNFTLPSGKTISLTFPLTSLVEKIIELSGVSGEKFSFTVRLRSFEQNIALARKLIPGYAEIRRIGGQVEMSKEVAHLIQCAKSGGWSVMESIGVSASSTGFQQALQTFIESEFDRLYTSVVPDSLGFKWDQLLQTFDPPGPSLPLSTLRDTEYLVRVFECVSDSSVAQKFDAGSLIPVIDLKPNCEIGQTFSDGSVFISYSRKDRAFVHQLISLFAEENINFWHDAKLETGVVWDEELESRIARCGVFLACVSDNYQNSKYCRRELKFADASEKTILPVSREPWIWGIGLRMMFQEYQISQIASQNTKQALVEKILKLQPHHASKD